ncbi:hypothetical protein HZA96_02725 [Candidatus Woesearchaeota archaeon]|nr:hypothetical protein [Candidatus Woesearchaeota archaeon]
MGKLTGLGIFLIIFGAGSLALPFFELQFKLFMLFELLFGAYSWIVSLICILAGVAMFIHFKDKEKDEAN